MSKAREVSNICLYIKKLCQQKDISIIEESATFDFSKAFTPKSLMEYEKLEIISKSHGGSVISNTYLGNLIKLNFKCRKNHEFLMTPKNVKKGNWCQLCAGVAKKDISWCKILAENNKGVCLSNTYKNNRTKMWWKCHVVNHVAWEAPADRIQQGHWCPECGNAKKGKKNERYSFPILPKK